MVAGKPVIPIVTGTQLSTNTVSEDEITVVGAANN